MFIFFPSNSVAVFSEIGLIVKRFGGNPHDGWSRHPVHDKFRHANAFLDTHNNFSMGCVADNFGISALQPGAHIEGLLPRLLRDVSQWCRVQGP